MQELQTVVCTKNKTFVNKTSRQHEHKPVYLQALSFIQQWIFSQHKYKAAAILNKLHRLGSFIYKAIQQIKGWSNP